MIDKREVDQSTGSRGQSVVEMIRFAALGPEALRSLP